MDVTVLIDAIVRQTTVLIAQLATASGARPLLAHTANQVFLDLVHELKEQGLGNKVIADMFGMALRTYHSKVRRLGESGTFRGRSLWSETLKFIQDRSTVLQADVLDRFRRDDEATVRGVLTDLVESGMVFKSGRGTTTAYRAARPEEYQLGPLANREDVAENLVWVAVNRFGPADQESIQEVVPLESEALGKALAALVRDGRIARTERRHRVEYESDRCLIPFGAPAGWEAAVFDHYQAMVTALCTKLQLGARHAERDDRIGGSTYSYLVWPGHPMEQEVHGLLAKLRETASRLREAVGTYNTLHPEPASGMTRVIAYVGQTLSEYDVEGDDS